ncbi:MAG: DNA-3-methyladenine glycosylase 2 family protein [Gammaproteobacteria bacterium]
MTSQKEQLSYLLKSDKDLEELIKSIPKIVPFKREKGFEGLVRLICEQQLSVASAKAIFDRLAIIVSPFEAKNFLKVSKKDLQKTGLSRQKIDYCTGLANACIAGDLDFTTLHRMNDEDLRKELCKIKGIGKWTADCYMLASLKREDIWPVGDLGLQISVQKLKKLPNRPSEMELEEISVKWKPYRTLVANMLWNSYD